MPGDYRFMMPTLKQNTFCLGLSERAAIWPLVCQSGVCCSVTPKNGKSEAIDNEDLDY